MPNHLPPLLFVLGKGGVGKTTVAAALALAYARVRQRVALVEVGAEQLTSLIDTAVDHRGYAVDEYLTAFSLTPHEAFAEYLTERVGSAALYRKVFDNRFVHYFLDAIPGVNALACLGKIWHMVTHEAWDRVVVDLPATGHGIGFLKAPRVITKSVSRGPLYDQGIQIEALLEDARRTGTLLVTQCEELPVNETLEAADQVRTQLRMALSRVVANRVRGAQLPPSTRQAVTQLRVDDPADARWQGLCALADFAHAQWTRQEQGRARLQATFGELLYELPEVEAGQGWQCATLLAAQMEGWL